MRAALALIPLLTGCDLLGLDTGSGTGSGAPPTTDWRPTEGVWQGSSHPCVGNRTDAMWWDDTRTVFVGCGSTTIGTGLYRSDDGGTVWTEVAPNRLGAFRVSSIQRAADGALYVAGIDTTSEDRVVRIDEDGSQTAVFQAGDQLWNSFHVGTFRRAPSGLAVAESLTGTGLVWRGTDGAAFEDGSAWPTDGGSYQILDMVLHADALYGAGSTIAVPPHVFLPSSTSPFALDPVQLADWPGELWAVAADGGGVVVGGVNQEDNVGAIFASGSSPSRAADFAEIALDDIVGPGPHWIRGVCRDGDLIAAVGEYSMRADPVLVVSADGGTTWVDWTDALPGSPRALHKCTLWSGGRLALTGQDGYLAVWTPG